MYGHTIWQWILFFYIYCFIGWCIESTIVSLSRRKFINRGFLAGPYLPLYGTGALLVLLSTVPFRGNYMMVFITGMISATILEYITDTVMEVLFKVKYWDYSYRKIQFQGKICLVSSLFWGVLSLILTEIVQSPIEKLVEPLPDAIGVYIIIGVGFIICIDIYYSIKAAFDLKHTLEKLAVIKVEMEKLQRQVNKAKESAAEQFNKIREATANKTREETNNFKERIRGLQAESEKITSAPGKLKQRILKAYPHARSNIFNESLKELREKIKIRRK